MLYRATECDGGGNKCAVNYMVIVVLMMLERNGIGERGCREGEGPKVEIIAVSMWMALMRVTGRGRRGVCVQGYRGWEEKGPGVELCVLHCVDTMCSMSSCSQ